MVSVISGIIISNHVFRELWTGVALHRSIFVHQLHIASAYAMVILCGMHIGMHWSSLWSRMKKWPIIGILADKPSLRFGVLVLIGWTGSALARLDHVGDRLLMKHIFGTLASQLPSILYYAMLLCMMGIYAMGFYYLQKRWQQKAIPRKGGAGK